MSGGKVADIVSACRASPFLGVPRLAQGNPGPAGLRLIRSTANMDPFSPLLRNRIKWLTDRFRDVVSSGIGFTALSVASVD